MQKEQHSIDMLSKTTSKLADYLLAVAIPIALQEKFDLFKTELDEFVANYVPAPKRAGGVNKADSIIPGILECLEGGKKLRFIDILRIFEEKGICKTDTLRRYLMRLQFQENKIGRDAELKYYLLTDETPVVEDIETPESLPPEMNEPDDPAPAIEVISSSENSEEVVTQKPNQTMTYEEYKEKHKDCGIKAKRIALNYRLNRICDECQTF